MTSPIDFEKIARQIHEFYRTEYATGQRPYEELPEFRKADNRAAARRIGQVLSLLGMRLARRENGAWSDDDQGEIRTLLTDDDFLDLLAEGEHDGWTEARLRQGWRLGPSLVPVLRQTHLLVPWSEFPARVKRKRQKAGPAKKDGVDMTFDAEVRAEYEKDRDSVRHYVDIIADTEYRIVRDQRLPKDDAPVA